MSENNKRIDLEGTNAMLEEGVLGTSIRGNDARGIDDETRHARAEVSCQSSFYTFGEPVNDTAVMAFVIADVLFCLAREIVEQRSERSRCQVESSL